MKTRILGISFLILLLFAGTAGAYTWTATGSNPKSGETLAASVDFSINGSGQLVVVLTNTVTGTNSDVLVPSDILSAVFFSLPGVTLATRTNSSAVLTAGSSVFYDPDGQPAGGVVGGEWAYKGALSGAPYSATSGISSSGFGTDAIPMFGPQNLFPGSDLAPPASPDGVNYGILSAGDNTATGNNKVTGSGGLIKDSVTFTLNVLS